MKLKDKLNEADDLKETKKILVDIKERIRALENNFDEPSSGIAERTYVLAFLSTRLFKNFLYEHPELKDEFKDEIKDLITKLQKI